MTSHPDTKSPSPSRPRVRWRALAYGLFVAVGLNAFDPISKYHIDSSTFANSHIPLTVLLGLLLPAYIYNPLARRWRPDWVLDHRDLAGALAVGFIGGTIPSFGARFLGVISAPAYFATPENEWPTYVIPNLQRWLFPSDVGDGVGMFYRGLPLEESIPWRIWATPLTWWLSFVACVVLACFCLMVILRRQWSDRERLAYPLVELPLLLVQDPEPGCSYPGFVKKKAFWIGFGVAAFIILWNALGHFYPALPIFSFVNRYTLLSFGRGFMDLYFRFDFYVVCFAFFTPLEILLSMWLFHLLAVTQEGVFRRIGFGPGSGGAGSWSQNGWALTVFVIWGLWMARRQFRDVWRKAIGRAPEIDDSQELLSYRAAAFGFVFSSLFIFFWLCQTNMGPGIALGYMLSTLVLYLGMAKIVSLSGLISLRGTAPGVLSLVGTQNLGDTSIAALHQISSGMFAYVKGFAMTGSANAARAAEASDIDKRSLGATILVASMLAILAFLFVSLLLGYHGMGAENFGDYEYTVGNRFGFDYTVSGIKGRDEAKRDWWGLGFGAFGAVTMAVLIFLNQRLSWWPIHPVGFTVSIQWPTRASFLSVFLAWLIKFVVLRIGGIALYDRAKIFMIGVLLGYVTGVIIAFLLDVIFFPGQGHAIHWPPI